jgi:hypothetical protein
LKEKPKFLMDLILPDYLLDPCHAIKQIMLEEEQFVPYDDHNVPFCPLPTDLNGAILKITKFLYDKSKYLSNEYLELVYQTSLEFGLFVGKEQILHNSFQNMSEVGNRFIGAKLMEEIR